MASCDDSLVRDISPGGGPVAAGALEDAGLQPLALNMGSASRERVRGTVWPDWSFDVFTMRLSAAMFHLNLDSEPSYEGLADASGDARGASRSLDGLKSGSYTDGEGLSFRSRP